MAAAAASAPIAQAASHVTAAAARLFPPGRVVPAAAVLAVAVGLASMLPSLAQAVWEVPHLFVLGLVISYGVFTQRNTDAEQTAHCDDNAGGALAWNARYRPEEPLIVVADHDGAREGAMERPLSLPVRRLKQPPSQATKTESDTTDDCVGEETESSASSAAGFCGGARTAPSPPSVLDADLGLSPCSPQPQSPPFFAHSSATARSRSFSSGYEHPYMARDATLSEEDGEVSDWDDEEDVDASDGMTVSSERSSARGDFVVTAGANDHNDDGDGDDEEDDTSVEEELLNLASRAAPERKDEVDRKADEFIAKFREQIRRQKL